MTIIHGPLVKKFREKKHWTQEVLAEQANLDVGTVSRIERQERYNVRRNTLENLVRALEVSVADLIQSRRPEVERDVMKLSVGNAARNALALVAHRYRVSRSVIMEAAPLLFFVMAEQSLKERQRRLDGLRDAHEALINLQWEAGHLPVTAPLDETMLYAEQESINDRDLFGRRVIDGDNSFLGELRPDFKDEIDNPLATFMRRVVAELNCPEDIAGDLEWQLGDSPYYRVCLEEVGKLVDGDEQAVEAILGGVAPLHEMPKDSASERVKWARKAKDENDRKLRELFGDFDLEFGFEGQEELKAAGQGGAP